MAAMEEKNKLLHEQLDAYMAISSGNIFTKAKNTKKLKAFCVAKAILS